MPFSCYGSKFEFNAADRIALKKPHASGDWSGCGALFAFLETTEILIH